MNKIREEFADKLLGEGFLSIEDKTMLKMRWKEAGYIEQSSLDKAREKNCPITTIVDTREYTGKELRKMVEYFEAKEYYYEQAIKELQDAD